MIRHSARWINVEVVDVEVRERDDEVERAAGLVCGLRHVLLHVHSMKYVAQTRCTGVRRIFNMHIQITAHNNGTSMHH